VHSDVRKIKKKFAENNDEEVRGTEKWGLGEERGARSLTYDRKRLKKRGRETVVP